MAPGDTPATPSALTHGLSSRWIFQALEEEVDELSKCLAGCSVDDAGVVEAARKAAEAILRLRQVRAMKTLALNRARPGLQPTLRTADALRDFARGLTPRERPQRNASATAGTATDKAVLAYMESSEALLRRLDEYERRALSQRARAIRELDYARIEVERRLPSGADVRGRQQ